MLKDINRPAKIRIALFTAVLFVLINCIVLFTVSAIKFWMATDAERQFKYVSEPSLLFSFIASIVLVFVSYIVYQIHKHLWKRAKLWTRGVQILLVTTTTMYILSTFSYVGIAGFWNQVLIALKLAVLTSVNFFIPITEFFLERRMKITKASK